MESKQEIFVLADLGSALLGKPGIEAPNLVKVLNAVKESYMQTCNSVCKLDVDKIPLELGCLEKFEQILMAQPIVFEKSCSHALRSTT